jgi:hypothetical protein
MWAPLAQTQSLTFPPRIAPHELARQAIGDNRHPPAAYYLTSLTGSRLDLRSTRSYVGAG